MIRYYIIVDGKLEATFVEDQQEDAKQFVAEFYSFDKDEPDHVIQVIKGEDIDFEADIKISFIE